MEATQIEQILLDQLEDLNVNLIPNLCHRKEETLVDLDSRLAQVVIGVRRSGKSTLCKNVLAQAKVKFGYVNFDDERLTLLQTNELDKVLEALYRIHGELNYFFFDEIQNVEHWALFVNRLLRMGKHLLITGSNSKLLSGELASHLTGRYHKIELLPFSFAEFCTYKQVALSPLTTMNRGVIAHTFQQYLQQGGFPELMVEHNAKAYIDTLFHNIITQDIQKRYKIRNTDTLNRLANHLANIAPAKIVKNDLQELFAFRSAHTLGNYLSYLEQAYLMLPLSRYSTKSRLRTNNEKVYTIDVAMMNNRENAFSGQNLGWRLETLVYLELRRRLQYETQDIYYYATSKTECDFLTAEGNRVTGIYQVSYDISNTKTLRREINGCLSAARTTGCKNIYLLTNNHKETIVSDSFTIQCMPVWEWLIK